jgi:mannan endo-1,4-beta-mannosidase
VNRLIRAVLLVGVTVVVAVACLTVVLRPVAAPEAQLAAAGHCGPPRHMPARTAVSDQYIGAFTPGHPGGSEFAQFARATGTRPSIVPYFVRFGRTWDPQPACRILTDGALPVIQINPRRVPLARIADGHRDGYLRTYAAGVAAFGYPVVISFGHEMNGYWYSWSYRHTSPAVFVRAWRHIIDVFRRSGAYNVTWLWTVNIIDKRGGIPSPAAWWPGSKYVDWVGMDGYYYKPSWTFASLFGPTIRAIRALTLDPILITETAAPPAAGQAKKIADLSASVHGYGLLGFVWFNWNKKLPWQLRGSAALAAYRQAAASFREPGHD